eukprot:11186175-Lingulodinium_polyedra.AAC.1
MRHYVYVDNLGVMGDTRPAVGGALNELEAGFGSNGLDLHPGELFHGEAESLGNELDGVAFRSSVTNRRYWR